MNKLKDNIVVKTTLLLIILIIVNFMLTRSFFRIDLTSEKRFTLSQQTKKILRSIKEPIYIDVYLGGDLPIGFKRLKRSINDLLNEFNTYSENSIHIKFINPSANVNSKERNRLYTELARIGIKPININAKDREGGVVQKLIFPGAIIMFSGKEIAVNLLENNPGLTAEENFNSSVESMEYKFIQAIREIQTRVKIPLAFIEGEGELNEYEVADITGELDKFYKVDRVSINGTAGILDPYKLIIIAKPRLPFKEKDKFIIDQYIMNGGRVLWLIDPIAVEMDSIAASGETVALIRQLNIEDQLFNYGIRINPVLVEDIQCLQIPVNNSVAGTQTSYIPAPWLYSVLINGSPEHPISRNLNMIKSEFISNIDTVGENSDIKKTILLSSSKLSRIKTIPARIGLDEIARRHTPAEFNKPNQILGILVEGSFRSSFKNRAVSPYLASIGSFKEKGKPTAMIFLADGDIIRNSLHVRPDGIMIENLGYDRYSKQTFGNKEFLINAVNYLADESGIITLRSREIKLRLLDKEKILNHRFTLQLINTLFPVLLVLIIAFIVTFMRRKKFTGSFRKL